MTILASFLATLGLLPAVHAAGASGFDADAIAQVSRGIAEWKLTEGHPRAEQAGRVVYVSSSLNHAGGTGRGGVVAISGLRAMIDTGQVDPALHTTVKWVNKVYNGNVWIRVDPTLDSAGRWEPAARTIWYNPNWVGTTPMGRPVKPEYNTVISHELDHAWRDGVALKRSGHISDWEVWRSGNTVIYDSKEGSAIAAANRFNSRLGERVPDSYSQLRMTVINQTLDDLEKGRSLSQSYSHNTLPHDYSIGTSQNPATVRVVDMSAGRPVTQSYPVFNDASRNWGGRMPTSSPIPGGMQMSSRYPSPDVLFSTKDPLLTYTSRLPPSPIPTYSNYPVGSLPRLPPPILPPPQSLPTTPR
jgi:hypothetical protein